jgi:hypothetical protein
LLHVEKGGDETYQNNISYAINMISWYVCLLTFLAFNLIIAATLCMSAGWEKWWLNNSKFVVWVDRVTKKGNYAFLSSFHWSKSTEDLVIDPPRLGKKKLLSSKHTVIARIFNK